MLPKLFLKHNMYSPQEPTDLRCRAHAVPHCRPLIGTFIPTLSVLYFLCNRIHSAYWLLTPLFIQSIFHPSFFMHAFSFYHLAGFCGLSDPYSSATPSLIVIPLMMASLIQQWDPSQSHNPIFNYSSKQHPQQHSSDAITSTQPQS